MLSFDAPASELLDELALEQLPFADPLHDLLARAPSADEAGRRLWPTGEHAVRSGALASSGVRSPPLA